MATIITTSTPLDSTSSSLELSRGGRWAVLIAAFLGLMFDGFELGLMPVPHCSEIPEEEVTTGTRHPAEQRKE